MRKYLRNERHPDGSGVPDMPEAKWLPSGKPDFSQFTNDSEREKDIIENVRKFLVNKHGQAEGITRLRTMNTEQLFKINEDIEREKFDNAAPGTACISTPLIDWTKVGK